MTKITMGTFIASLRKEKGLTQKDIAIRLNVSDKTVSRWERDEGYPDLSLIPVIAEIFNVSCDEILNGRFIKDTELNNQKDGDHLNIKQINHILNHAMHKFENSNIITIAIIITGFIIAMIANFGFYEARIGFFIGILFLMISIVQHKISYNNFMYSIIHEDFDTQIVKPYKYKRFKITRIISLCIITSFIALLPLILLVNGINQGVGMIYFIFLGLMIIFVVVLYKLLLEVYIIKSAIKKVLIIENDSYSKMFSVQKLNNKTVIIFAALTVFVIIVQILYSSTCTTLMMSKDQQFNNFDEFTSHMSKEIKFTNINYTADHIKDNIEYNFKYDMISKIVLIDNIHESSNLVFTFSNKEMNTSISVLVNFKLGSGNEIEKITVYTQDEMDDGIDLYYKYGNLINIGYPISLVLTCVYYFCNRKKYTKIN